MNRIYFLATSLPSLHMNQPPEMGFDELQFMMSEHFSAFSMDKVKNLRMLTDIDNLLHFLNDESLDPRGNLTEAELEEAITHEMFFPEFVYDFLVKYSTKEDRVLHFDQLYKAFFDEKIDNESGFVRDYYLFERNLRLVLAAHRALKMGEDLVEVFKEQDLQDSFVMELLTQKDQKQLQFPMEFADLQNQLARSQTPIEDYQAVEGFRLEAYERLVMDKEFTVDYVLSYLMRLMIVENSCRFDDHAAHAVFEELI